MRQLLLVFTSVLEKDESPRAGQLRTQATTTFLDIICGRQDRLKVKPALQGLAHFLLRDIMSIPQMIELHEEVLRRSSSRLQRASTSQQLLEAFLAWVVHHDTSLSTGHLVKTFLFQARKLPTYWVSNRDGVLLPLWIDPVVRTLHQWPERMQEFKTHVFPHCFLPNINEFTAFLSFLRFDVHMQSKVALSENLRGLGGYNRELNEVEEFRVLLAAIEVGKEMNIARDRGKYPKLICVSKLTLLYRFQNLQYSRDRRRCCVRT